MKKVVLAAMLLGVGATAASADLFKLQFDHREPSGECIYKGGVRNMIYGEKDQDFCKNMLLYDSYHKVVIHDTHDIYND